MRLTVAEREAIELREKCRDARLAIELLWSACNRGQHMDVAEKQHVEKTIKLLASH